MWLNQSRQLTTDQSIYRKANFLYFLPLMVWWILAMIGSELIEEFSFWFETSFAIAQWLVLRQHIRHIGWWVLVSVWGWVIAFILIQGFDLRDALVPLFPTGEWVNGAASLSIARFWASAVARLLEWTIIGFCQWLLLRCYMKGAYWWILANAFAGGLKGATELTLRVFLEIPAPDASMLAAVGGALVYAVVTGIVLMGLLKNDAQRRLEYIRSIDNERNSRNLQY